MNWKKLGRNMLWCLTAYKIINDLPDSVVFADPEGYIKRANRKAFECFGFSIEEDNPLKIDDFIKEGLDAVNESIKLQRPVLATAVIPGREFYVELNASERSSGFCITIRDLTKLTNEIATKEKIETFNSEKNAMLVKLETDIKSPITSISGFSQGLLDGLGGELSEKQTKYIKIINSNSNELYHFMDKFLEFTYTESSLYEPMIQNFDIIEAFKGIIKDFEPKLEEKKLAFDFDYDTIDKRTVYMDFRAVNKILRNIIEVALSMTETGYISVKLKQSDEKTAARFGLTSTESLKGYFHLSVKDTGTGVPDDEMKYLCEPYAQLEKGKKNFLRAVKLGTVSILTKRLNGNIFISSESGKGTMYDIIFPVVKEANE